MNILTEAKIPTIIKERTSKYLSMLFIAIALLGLTPSASGQEDSTAQQTQLNSLYLALIHSPTPKAYAEVGISVTKRAEHESTPETLLGNASVVHISPDGKTVTLIGSGHVMRDQNNPVYEEYTTIIDDASITIPRHATKPVIAMSGYVCQETQANNIDAGGHDFSVISVTVDQRLPVIAGAVIPNSNPATNETLVGFPVDSTAREFETALQLQVTGSADETADGINDVIYTLPLTDRQYHQYPGTSGTSVRVVGKNETIVEGVIRSQLGDDPNQPPTRIDVSPINLDLIDTDECGQIQFKPTTNDADTRELVTRIPINVASKQLQTEQVTITVQLLP